MQTAITLSIHAPCEAILSETIFHDTLASTWQLMQFQYKADCQKCPPNRVVHSLDYLTCHPSIAYQPQYLVLNCSPHYMITHKNLISVAIITCQSLYYGNYK